MLRAMLRAMLKAGGAVADGGLRGLGVKGARGDSGVGQVHKQQMTTVAATVGSVLTCSMALCTARVS